MLDAVEGCTVELVGVQAPFLAVGLDAGGSCCPEAASADLGCGDGSEESDEVLGLGLDGIPTELAPAIGDSGGELVAVGEEVGVVVEPVEAVLLSGFELLDVLIQLPELTAQVPAVTGESAGRQRRDAVSSCGEPVELDAAVGRGVLVHPPLQVGEPGLENGE